MSFLLAAHTFLAPSYPQGSNNLKRCVFIHGCDIVTDPMRMFDVRDEPAEGAPTDPRIRHRQMNTAPNFVVPDDTYEAFVAAGDTADAVLQVYTQYVQADQFGTSHMAKGLPATREYLKRVHRCLRHWPREHRDDLENIARLRSSAGVLEYLVSHPPVQR